MISAELKSIKSLIHFLITEPQWILIIGKCCVINKENRKFFKKRLIGKNNVSFWKEVDF